MLIVPSNEIEKIHSPLLAAPYKSIESFDRNVDLLFGVFHSFIFFIISGNCPLSLDFNIPPPLF